MIFNVEFIMKEMEVQIFQKFFRRTFILWMLSLIIHTAWNNQASEYENDIELQEFLPAPAVIRPANTFIFSGA